MKSLMMSLVLLWPFSVGEAQASHYSRRVHSYRTRPLYNPMGTIQNPIRKQNSQGIWFFMWKQDGMWVAQTQSGGLFFYRNGTWSPKKERHAQGFPEFHLFSNQNVQSNNSDLFEGREIIEPSPTDKNAYYNFSRKIKNWNCREKATQIFTVLPNSSLIDPKQYIDPAGNYFRDLNEYRARSKSIVEEGSQTLDNLEILRQEGVLPFHFTLDIRYGGKLPPSERPILFQNADTHVVIVTENGLTLNEMRQFFSSPEARRRFQQSQRRFSPQSSDEALLCRSGLVPRPQGINY